MNGCERMEERLNDLLDGLLPEEEAGETARHLDGCADCRAAFDALRALKAEAAALPATLQPGRDLWPGIEAGLDAGRAPLLAFGRRGGTAWRHPLGLAAAAVLLVAVTASITMVLMRPAPREPLRTAWSGPRGTAVLASYRQAESEFQVATTALQAALEERRDQLSPETVALLEENLRVIDAAIRQIWTALENDPGDAGNRHLFTALYQKKVMLLQQAIRLPAKG